MSTGQIPDPVEHVSVFGFDVTIDRLMAAITSAGMTVFARIDHAVNAAQVGMNMPPTSVLTYGNAKGGTPIMQAVPLAALDLPLRVLVREDGQRTLIAFHPVASTLQQVGVPADLAARLEPAQSLLIKAIQI